MKKFKLVFWLILVAVLGVVGWQNQAFFLEKRGIEVNYFVGTYHSPEFQIALYLLVFFLAGLLISYFGSLSERFVAKRTIRKLNNELTQLKKKVAERDTIIVDSPAPEAAAAQEAVEPVPENSGTKSA